VYEATSYAVPFLIELLQQPAVQDKHVLLVFLMDLANGSSYWDVHQHLDMFQERRDTDEMKDQIEEELEWVKAAHDSVRAGSSVYKELLGHDDIHIRMASALLLGSFPEVASSNFETLRVALTTEDEAAVRVAEIYAIGTLAPTEQRAVEFLQDALSQGETQSEQVAAALGLLGSHTRFALTPEIRSHAISLLCEAAASPGQVAEVFAEIQGIGADVDVLCSEVLVAFASEDDTATQVISAMVAGLQRLSPFLAWDLAESLLDVTFGGRPLPESATTGTLTPNQRMVLQAVADSDSFWIGDEQNQRIGNRSSVMMRFGLPERRAKLRAFIRGELSPRDKEWKRL
jgi:hypothetical protein